MPSLSHRRLLLPVALVGFPAILLLTSCESIEATDEPTEAVAFAGLLDERPDLQPAFADAGGGDTTDTPLPVTAPEPVAAMAHDVSLWTLTVEGLELVDFARVGESLYTSSQLAHGWRIDRWDRPDPTAAYVRGASEVHDRGDGDAPLLLSSDDDTHAMALWTDAGTLLVRHLATPQAGQPAPTTLFTADEATAAFLATETNELTSPPVATPVGDVHAGSEAWLVCAGENVRGVICTFMSAEGEVESWQTVGKLKDYEPLAIAPSSAGYVGVAGKCLDDDCSTMHLVTLHMDAKAVASKKRGARTLANIQTRRTPIITRSADGLFVTARRTRAQDATAWHVGATVAHELDGTFNRILGAVYLGGGDADRPGETWLLEESPLLMRGGFPVGLLRPLRWSSAIGREEPLAWPRAVYDRLPGQPGQRVLTRPGLIAILPAQRDQVTDVTFLQLKSNGELSAAPTPSRATRKERRQRRRRP